MSTQAPMGHRVRLRQKLEELGMKELSAGFSMSTMKGAENFIVIDLHKDDKDGKVMKIMKIIIGIFSNVDEKYIGGENYVLYITYFNVYVPGEAQEYKKRDLIHEFIVYALQEAVYKVTEANPSTKISYFMQPINISQYASLHHNKHPLNADDADERLISLLKRSHLKLRAMGPVYIKDQDKYLMEMILVDEKHDTIAKTTFCITPVTTFDGNTVKRENILLVVNRSSSVNFNDGGLLLDEFFVWSLQRMQEYDSSISFYSNLGNISERASKHASEHSSSPFRSKAKHRQLASLSGRKTKSRRKSRNGKKSSLKKKRHNI